jgi:hypothetical protein
LHETRPEQPFRMMMCMSDAVSVNIVHNFPKMYVKGKGTELLVISNRCK